MDPEIIVVRRYGFSRDFLLLFIVDETLLVLLFWPSSTGKMYMRKMERTGPQYLFMKFCFRPYLWLRMATPVYPTGKSTIPLLHIFLSLAMGDVENAGWTLDFLY